MFTSNEAKLTLNLGYTLRGIYTCVYVNSCVPMRACACLCVYGVCIHVRACMRGCVCVRMCAYVCVCVRVCVRMSMCSECAWYLYV